MATMTSSATTVAEWVATSVQRASTPPRPLSVLQSAQAPFGTRFQGVSPAVTVLTTPREAAATPMRAPRCTAAQTLNPTHHVVRRSLSCTIGCGPGINSVSPPPVACLGDAAARARASSRTLQEDGDAGAGPTVPRHYTPLRSLAAQSYGIAHTPIAAGASGTAVTPPVPMSTRESAAVAAAAASAAAASAALAVSANRWPQHTHPWQWGGLTDPASGIGGTSASGLPQDNANGQGNALVPGGSSGSAGGSTVSGSARNGAVSRQRSGLGGAIGRRGLGSSRQGSFDDSHDFGQEEAAAFHDRIRSVEAQLLHLEQERAGRAKCGMERLMDKYMRSERGPNPAAGAPSSSVAACF